MFCNGCIFRHKYKTNYWKNETSGRLRGVGTLRGCGVAARFASASVHLCGKLKITLIGKKGVCRGVHICGGWKLDSLQLCLSYPKKINFSKNPHFPHWHHWHIDNNCKLLIISIIKSNIYVNGCQWCQWSIPNFLLCQCVSMGCQRAFCS